jgi:hypothetical protein
MKKIVKISSLALAFLFFLNFDAAAQIKPSKKKTDEPTEQQTEDTKPSPTPKKKKTTKKNDEYFDESGGFKHRLWYGGNFNLGLNSAEGTSLFAIGITPMIGYKIIGGLSAGPRVGVNYTSIKSYDTQNKISSVGLTDFSIGAFTRYKAFKNFFAHAEYEYQSQQTAFGDSYNRIQLDAAGKAIKKRYDRSNNYIGLGYSSGEIFSYEIMALYNLSLPKTTLENPISIRAGLTYKF